MSDAQFTVLFCDEIARDETGQLSVTGLYAPLVIMQAPGPAHVTTVAFVRGPLGTDLSKHELSVNYSVDGGRKVKHAFPPLPKIEAVAKSASLGRRATAIRDRLNFDDGQLVGALRLDGIEFEETCVFTAELDGKRIWRSVFIRDEPLAPAEKKPKKASGKKATKRRTTVRTQAGAKHAGEK